MLVRHCNVSPASALHITPALREITYFQQSIFDYADTLGAGA